MYLLQIAFLSLVLLSCASTDDQALNLPNTKQVVLPPYASSEIKNANPVYFETKSTNEDLKKLLLEVGREIDEKTYIMSQVVPNAKIIRKDKAVRFLQKPDQENLKNQITIVLENDPKYSAYKLSIKYDDDKKRNWLFSLNSKNEVLKKQIQKTIIRFSFQSL